MQATVRWLYSRIDGHEPALVFEGSKNAHCVVLDYPIRVFQVNAREVKQMRPVVNQLDQPYNVVAMAKSYLEKEKSHRLTPAAKRLLELAVETKGLDTLGDDLEEDPDAELHLVQGVPTRRKSTAEVKEEINEKNYPTENDPKPKRRKKQVTELDLELESETKAIKSKSKDASNLTPRPASIVGKVCAELKMDPKDARKKLRAAGMHAPYDDEAKIRAVLSKTAK